MDQSLQLGLLVVGLVVAWIAIRVFMGVTRRLITLGCALLILLAAVWFIVSSTS